MCRRINLLLSFIVCSILINGKSFAINEIKLNQAEKELILQGEITSREVPAEREKGRTFEAIGLIKAKLNEIYQVLVDFENYNKFMPNVSKVETSSRTDNSAILNYTLSLPLGKTKKYRVSMNFNISDDTANLKWRMIPWEGIKESETIADTTGYWLLRNFTEKKGYVIILYHVYTDPGNVPLGLGWIVDILSKNSVPDVVVKTRERVHQIHKK